MLDLKQSLLHGVGIKHIWVFITDKCNLNCDYCFFSEKKGKYSLDAAKITALFGLLPKARPYDFIVSGGEPLLYWAFASKLIIRIKKQFPRSEITLQTNALLLNLLKVQFLKAHGVVIEPGVDGNFVTNFRHRKGFTRKNFSVFLHSLNLIVKHKLRMNPTMTVHPEESKHMFDNFRVLLSLGLRSIDIHPALLAQWTEAACMAFLKEYKKVILYERETGLHLVSKNYSVPISRCLDLIIQPDGFVLPNWAFMAFPYRLRRNFFIMRIDKGKVEFMENNLRAYLLRLQTFFERERSYRDFSNFNATIALEAVKDRKLHVCFSEYKILTEEIQKIDRFFLKNADMQ